MMGGIGNAARVLSQLGRKGDSAVGHLTPGELVIPQSAQSPQLMQMFQQTMAQRGVNPMQYMVGHPQNRTNPQTGVPEFADDEVWYSNTDSDDPSQTWYSDPTYDTAGLDESAFMPYGLEESQEADDQNDGFIERAIKGMTSPKSLLGGGAAMVGNAILPGLGGLIGGYLGNKMAPDQWSGSPSPASQPTNSKSLLDGISFGNRPKDNATTNLSGNIALDFRGPPIEMTGNLSPGLSWTGNSTTAENMGANWDLPGLEPGGEGDYDLGGMMDVGGSLPWEMSGTGRNVQRIGPEDDGKTRNINIRDIDMGMINPHEMGKGAPITGTPQSTKPPGKYSKDMMDMYNWWNSTFPNIPINFDNARGKAFDGNVDKDYQEGDQIRDRLLQELEERNQIRDQSPFGPGGPNDPSLDGFGFVDAPRTTIQQPTINGGWPAGRTMDEFTTNLYSTYGYGPEHKFLSDYKFNNLRDDVGGPVPRQYPLEPLPYNRGSPKNGWPDDRPVNFPLVY